VCVCVCVSTWPPQQIKLSTMKAAGGTSREERSLSNSAAAKSVVSSGVRPRRYASGHMSLTVSAGVSTAEYLLYLQEILAR